MNWEAIGAVGEILGAFVVVLSLVYLAVQVKDNAKVMRATAWQAASDELIDFTTFVMESERALPMFLKSSAGLKILTQEERLRFHFMAISFLRRYDMFFVQQSLGVAQDLPVEGFWNSLDDLFTNPAMKEWWPTSRKYFSPGFADHIDKIYDRVGSEVRDLGPMNWADMADSLTSISIQDDDGSAN